MKMRNRDTARVTFAIIMLFFLIGMPLIFGLVDKIEQGVDLQTAIKQLKQHQQQAVNP